ncbi:MAG TPA: hypothetical protein VMT54_00210 [Candidatus Cybelea sp.]|nr:hypothetical protein [Candidatus Cybelea sp.]
MNIASYARLAAAALVAAVVLSAVAITARADKLTEDNMTQKDYDDITNMDTGTGADKVDPPIPMHDLTDAGKQGVKDGNGVKVFKGKDWKKMSAADRGKAIRDLRKNKNFSTTIFIEVPSGNVWVVDGPAFIKLVDDKVIRAWDKAEKEKLPKAVRGDASNRPEIRRSEGERFDVFSQF